MGKPRIFPAKIIDVYDGDTFTFDVDLGFEVSVVSKLRLYGIDTPEMRGDEKEQGTIVRNYVRDKILDRYVEIEVFKKGKFGRYVAKVRYEDPNTGEVFDLSQDLYSRGMAKKLDYK